jgi:hypothetical protein
MIARSAGILGGGFVGDTLLLTGVRPPPVEHTELVRMLARWDLLLWSPFFLLWGTCWATAGWRLGRRGQLPGKSGSSSLFGQADSTVSS